MKNYLNSFKNKNILITIIPDTIIVILFYFLFTGFFGLIQTQIENISGGLPPEQIQQLLLAGTTEQAQQLLTQMQTLVYSFIIVGVLFLAITLLTFSFSRAWIWNKILKHRLSKKNFWKWVGLHIALLIPIIFYIIIIVFLRAITAAIFGFSQQGLYIAQGILSILLVTIFLIYLFLVYKSFTEKYKVWESIGHGFHLIKVNFKKLSKTFSFTILTLIVLNFLLLLINKLFFVQFQLITVLQVIIFLFFVSWMRLYILKAVD